MNSQYPSVDTMDSTNRAISKRMKSLSIQVQSMNRTWIKNKYHKSDNYVFERMSLIFKQISDIQDELDSICEIMKVDTDPENVTIPDKIIITGKEFTIMNQLFILYMSGARV